MKDDTAMRMQLFFSDRMPGVHVEVNTVRRGGERERLEDQHDLGAKRVFEFQAQTGCDICDASGIAKGYGLKACETCKGTGQVRQSTRTPFGSFTRVGICPTCHGKWQVAEKECSICNGSGRIKTKRTIELHVPKDISDGYSIVMPKQGNAGKHSVPPGDLLITLVLK